MCACVAADCAQDVVCVNIHVQVSRWTWPEKRLLRGIVWLSILQEFTCCLLLNTGLWLDLLGSRCCTSNMSSIAQQTRALHLACRSHRTMQPEKYRHQPRHGSRIFSAQVAQCYPGHGNGSKLALVTGGNTGELLGRTMTGQSRNQARNPALTAMSVLALLIYTWSACVAKSNRGIMVGLGAGA
jgi:hypothetical protein